MMNGKGGGGGGGGGGGEARTDRDQDKDRISKGNDGEDLNFQKKKLKKKKKLKVPLLLNLELKLKKKKKKKKKKMQVLIQQEYFKLLAEMIRDNDSKTLELKNLQETRDRVFIPASEENHGNQKGSSNGNDLRIDISQLVAAVNGVTEVLKVSGQLEKKVDSHDGKVKQMTKDLRELKLNVDELRGQAMAAPQGENAAQGENPGETAREIQQKQVKIIEEEKELQGRLDKSLQRSIVTIASFFISFHTLLAGSQPPTNDKFRFILICFLIGMIWVATLFLLGIWWNKLKGIENEITSLEANQVDLRSLADRKKVTGIRPHMQLTTFKSILYRCLIVFFVIFATAFSVYFGYISYSLWLPTASPPPAPTIEMPSSLPLYASQ